MREASVDQLRARLLDTLVWLSCLVLLYHRSPQVQPVVWSYGEQLSLSPGLLQRYEQLWGEAQVAGRRMEENNPGDEHCSLLASDGRYVFF